MDFTLHDAFSSVFNEDKSEWDKGMIKVYENFTNDFLYPNTNNLLTFIENHDTQRFNHLYPDFRKYQMALTLIATIRGIPQLYYGSELLMKGISNPDGWVRLDFPGGWAGDKKNAFTGVGLTNDEKMMQDYVKTLANFRLKSSAITKGKMMQYVPQDGVYVYFRYDDKQTIMVVMNTAKENKTIALKVNFTTFLKYVCLFI